MSIRLAIAIILLFTTVYSVTSIREYVIRKDFFRFVKASEYTIYDRTGKKVLYRIESQFSLLHKIKLIAYPSKKEVGHLNAEIKFLYYQAQFSIVDSETNQRQDGSIVQDAKFLKDIHLIHWKGKNITMETKPFSVTTEFRDPMNGEFLAEFHLRPASIFWTRKYDMKIYSYAYPEQLYFLALSVCDLKYRKS